MSLRDYEIRTSVAVSDMERARRFYEGQLGLPGSVHDDDGSVVYTCGRATVLHVYPSPENAGKSPATLATWMVDDVEAVVDELRGNGVEFEHYDEADMKTDEKGIFRDGDFAVAWFSDPDGNIFAIERAA